MNFLGAYTCCPFDKSHQIQEGRLQIHLFKCRQNYPKTTKVTCPFNAIHILDPQEYEHHLSVCPTSGNIKCDEYVLEPQVQVGTVSLESACKLQCTTLNEDWSGNNPTYDPFVASENKNVIRTAIGLSKAKKKQFKKHERQRLAALENRNNNDCNNIKGPKQKPPKLESPLRAPKKAAKAIPSDLKSDTMINSSDDLISKLKEVSIEENKENAWSKKNSQESISNNTFSKETNRSLISKKMFQPENMKNILQEEIGTSVNH